MSDKATLIKTIMNKIPDNTNNRNAKKKIILSASVCIASILLICFILCFILIHYCSADKTIEINEEPDYKFITENSFLNTFCQINTDYKAIDTSKLSTHTIDFTFLRFIRYTSTLRVIDSTPPQITVHNVIATSKTKVTGDMFVNNIKDNTNVNISVDKDTTQLPEGNHTITIRAVDEAQNSTEAQAKITIISPNVPLYFENGTPMEDIEKTLNSTFGKNIDFNMPAQDECAKITVSGKDKNTIYYIDIEINDTIAPTATVKSFDLVLGEKVTKDDIITDIFDHSAVKMTISELPDFKSSGEYTVNIKLTDEYNNISDFKSCIRIHDINTEIDVEINSYNKDIIDKIYNDNFSKNNLFLKKEYFFNFLGIKTTKLTLNGKYNSIIIKANVVDTTRPVLKLRYVEKFITANVKPEEFVYLCKDSTKVTYSFAEQPDTSQTGTFRTTVVATDACGNVTEATADLIIHADTTPPEIHGAEDITTVIGKTPDYKTGVTTTDEISKYIDLCVDSSQVDINTLGVYPLTYIAMDHYRNVSKKTVYVTVKENIKISLNVENIKQYPSLPNGCEVVSLAIALKYNGFDINPVSLFKNYMPKTKFQENGDPWQTYIGDATEAGFGCYAPCVVKTGNDYLADMQSPLKVENVSEQDFSTYESYINDGIPVIMWATTYMIDDDTLCRSWKSNGKNVVWHYYSHCLVMIGYTEDTYIFCDPLRGIVEYSKESVERAFKINFRQACIIK